MRYQHTGTPEEFEADWDLLKAICNASNEGNRAEVRRIAADNLARLTPQHCEAILYDLNLTELMEVNKDSEEAAFWKAFDAHMNEHDMQAKGFTDLLKWAVLSETIKEWNR